jgi:P-type Cu+ transporter
VTAGRLEATAAALVGVVAVVVLGYRLGTGAPATAALAGAVAVVAVAVPAALRLVTGLPQVVGTARAAQLGVLLPGPEALAVARRIDTLLVAGVGPLGAGEAEVRDVHAVEGVATAEVLRLAGSVAQASDRPLDRAVAAAAADPLLDVAEFDEVDDLGVRGLVAEVVGAPGAPVVVAHAVLVGEVELLAVHEIVLPAELTEATGAITAAGGTPVVVAWDGIARAVLGVGRAAPSTTAAAVRALCELRVRVVLLAAGDAATAREVAARVGIDDVLAGSGPDEWPALVHGLRDTGAHVAVVADAGTDEAVLRAADLAVRVGCPAAGRSGTGTSSVLVPGDLPAAVEVLRLARRAGTVTRANAVWAVLCLAAVLPATAAGLLDPLLSATATAAAAAVLVGNGLRLQRHGSTDR